MDTTRSEQGALVATQLAEHLDYLRRFARSRTRDEHLAEEAVQETLLAALESEPHFAGRAKLRTWLTGILIHKIHDGFRRGSREITLREADLSEDLVEYLHEKADEGSAAMTPEHALHCRQLRAALDRAIKALPPRQKEAFLLKEVASLETDHMAKLLGVNSGNLWVLVHRARAHLQKALEREGFAPA